MSAKKVLASFQPQAVISFGGYASFPLLIFCQKFPLYLIEPNAVAGKVNEWFSVRAKAAFLQFAEAAGTLFCPSVVTGLPTRPFELSPAPKKPFVLFMGGSQGAKSLVEKAIFLSKLLRRRSIEVKLIAGRHFHKALMLKKKYKAPCEVLPFVENPMTLMAEAEVVVCRAGASTLAELACVGACPILLPYPHADRRHQLENALCFQRKTGCFVLPDEPQIEKLAQAMVSLLKNSALRETIAQNVRSFASFQAAEQILRNLRNIEPAADDGNPSL